MSDFTVDVKTGSDCTDGSYNPNSGNVMSWRTSSSCQGPSATHCGAGEWYWGSQGCNFNRLNAKCRSIPSNSTVCSVIPSATSAACPAHHVQAGSTWYVQAGSGDCAGGDVTPRAVTTGQSLKQCAQTCNNLGSKCNGFSYTSNGGGTCAPKSSCPGGKANQSNGYIKYDRAESGTTIIEPTSSPQWKAGKSAAHGAGTGEITCGFDYSQFDTAAKAAAFLKRFGSAYQSEYDKMMTSYCTAVVTSASCPKCTPLTNKMYDCTPGCTRLASKDQDCVTWAQGLPTTSGGSRMSRQDLINDICLPSANQQLTECACINRQDRADYQSQLKVVNDVDSMMATNANDFCWWPYCKESSFPQAPWKNEDDPKAPNCSNSICYNNISATSGGSVTDASQACKAELQSSSSTSTSTSSSSTSPGAGASASAGSGSGPAPYDGGSGGATAIATGSNAGDPYMPQRGMGSNMSQGGPFGAGTTAPSKKPSMSTGEIVGITAGSIIGFLLLVVGVRWFLSSRPQPSGN